MSISLKTEFQKRCDKRPYTASGAKTAGVPLQISAAVSKEVGIPASDIADGDIDELDVEGRFRVIKKAETWAIEQVVGWDANGDPAVGTAGTGAYTAVAADWDFPVGKVVEASANDVEQGVIALNEYPLDWSPTKVVAATGSIQGDAAALDYGFNHVTGADATKGALLPPAHPGRSVIVKNADAANAVLKIWPTVGDGVNAIAVNSAFSIAAKTSVLLVAIDTTTWYSLPLLPS